MTSGARFVPSLEIALVAHNVVGRDGQGRVMVELARVLADRGHQVTVYARTLAPDLVDRVTFHRLRRPPGPGLADDLALLAVGTAALRRRSHDVACVMGPCALPPQPFVYYAQFSQAGWQATWPMSERPSPYHVLHSRLGLALERRVSRWATRVIACSGRVADEIGVDRARTSVVPNGVSPAEFRPVTPALRSGARKRLGLPEDALVIVFAGEYRTPRKGLGPLIEAVGRGGDDEHLVVAGNGDEGWARELARRAGAAGRVHLVGFIDVSEVLPAGDVAAIPSLYEPFSISALEAAAAGLPLVISAAAGAAEYLAEAAVVVDPGHPEGLRAALDTLRADPELRRHMGAAGRRIAETLRWEAVAPRAAAVIEEAASAGTQRLERRAG